MGGSWISPTLPRSWLFKGDVRRKMKGLESLITGWHRRSYFGCVSSSQEKFQLKAMRQKSQAQKGTRETLYFCSDFPQTASPASRSPWFELVVVKKIRRSRTLTADFPANSQLPTLCDLNSLDSFADSYPEDTMNERNLVWRRLQGRDVGGDSIQWLPWWNL